MELEVAEISVNPKTKQLTEFKLLMSDLKFKCRRCAVFCCKLGGPPLTANDVERLKKERYNVKDFIEAASTQGVTSKEKKAFLKSREDGSCIFLKKDEGNISYTCSVYQNRPLLCRLYPFEFVPTGHTRESSGLSPVATD